MDVAEWLRGLGLERYEPVFRDNDIGGDVLARLTAEDLKELGVVSVGHRRRLLDAIASLRDAAATARTIPRSGAPPRDDTNRPPSADAERRQITVMFCDLVGSTALAARTDPEDLREIVDAYHRCITGSVEQFGGAVAEYMGDGALIYFGWPKAGEADPERAVRAGLALIEAIDRMSARGETLRSRIGIATGLVVGSGAAQRSAVGETPNLAARLQALAEPDSMVIDHSTRTQLGGLFECRDLGAVALKGFPAPVRAWSVLREISVRSRFEALHAETLTPLVGREEELELLLRRWRQVNDGEGRVVLMSGEPGIGKSRLVAALDQRLPGEAHTRLRYFCAPYHTDTALYPVTIQLERAARFERDDPAGVKLAKLEALVAPWSTDVAHDAALFADALSIPCGDRYPALNLSPQKRKEEMLRALLGQLAALAAERPVLATFEDVHWIDPTSLELLELAVERVQSLRVLLVITFRPEFTSRWTGLAHVTMLALNRLGHQHAATLIEQIAGATVLPPELRDQIIDHTDGVPLFIEELTKSVLENTARPSEPGAPLAIPGTLHASLMARLDRLPAAKQVAQIGAVIGREFRHDLLMAVAPIPEAELVAGLEQLLAAGLLFQRGGDGPQTFYQFKHALVRDAAYESLLRSHRGAVHAGIVGALRRLSPAVETTQPELLGHHCARAGLIEQAADYYRAAGERSIAQSAIAEARAHLERGLDLAEQLADGIERRRLEGSLQLALANVEIISVGYGGPEIATRLVRAVELSSDIGQDELLIRALFGEWTYKLHVGDLAGSLLVAQHMMALGRRQNDRGIRLAASTALGMNHAFAGRFAQAREVLEACLAEDAAGESEGLVAPLAQDADVLARSFLSLPLASMGHVGASTAEIEGSIERARRLGHHPSLAVALAIGCRHAWLVRDEDRARERAAELVSLCEAEGYPYWLARGQCYAGAIALIDGREQAGLALLHKGMTTLQDSGVVLWNIHSLVAEAHARRGHRDAALGLVDQGLEVSSKTTEVWTDAELHRLKGTILLMPPRPDPARAEEELQRAIAIAQSQSARLLELRSAVDLARLWAGQDRRDAARTLLTGIRGWFTHDASAVDLREADVLLDALG